MVGRWHPTTAIALRLDASVQILSDLLKPQVLFVVPSHVVLLLDCQKQHQHRQLVGS